VARLKLEVHSQNTVSMHGDVNVDVMIERSSANTTAAGQCEIYVSVQLHMHVHFGKVQAKAAEHEQWCGT